MSFKFMEILTGFMGYLENLEFNIFCQNYVSLGC